MILGAIFLVTLILSAVATTLLALAMLLCGEHSWPMVFGISQVLWMALVVWFLVVNLFG